MKVFHRIRGYLIPLLLFMLHCSTDAQSAPDFKKCNVDDGGSLRCIVHASCTTSHSDDKYVEPTEIKDACKRYLLVQAKSLHEVEIEFRDDQLEKATGAKFQSTRGDAFSCVNNVAKPGAVTQISNDNSATGINELFCKFKVTDPNKEVLSILQDEMPRKIVGKLNGNDATIRIGGVTSFQELFVPCDWNSLTYQTVDETVEEKTVLVSTGEQSKMICPANYFNRYKAIGKNEWELIGDFTCFMGKVVFSVGPTRYNTEKTPGVTKCTRPRCSICKCSAGVCNTADPAKPQFNETDGDSCAKITCPNHKFMLVDTGSGDEVHKSDTIECSEESKSGLPKWKGGIGEIKNVTCINVISCMTLQKVRSECPAKTDGFTCTNATLNDAGLPVCKPVKQQIWFVPAGNGVAHQIDKFMCTDTGRWQGPKDSDVVKNSNVYCLEKIEPKNEAAPKTGSVTGGVLIGIILGIAACVIVIGGIIFLIYRCRMKKKGNRDEMKSVSVTGRNEKKSKKSKKRGKSSSSKTSEISAPPPPPCPDSLNLPNEPEPPVPPPSGPTSSGPVTPVGPDTGKPDKPALLVDIKLESEKKNDVSSKKEDKPKDADATEANTKTGTSFGDKSGAEPAKKDGTVTDTKKTDKNGESARSDTGRTGTKDETKKKKNPKKIQLDKNGRGLTDDDEFKIDEGAKPVNTVDKNKKPYAPPIDPRKKMINVTMTEDDDGHMKPKAKQSLF